MLISADRHAGYDPPLIGRRRPTTPTSQKWDAAPTRRRSCGRATDCTMRAPAR